MISLSVRGGAEREAERCSRR